MVRQSLAQRCKDVLDRLQMCRGNSSPNTYHVVHPDTGLAFCRFREETKHPPEPYVEGVQVCWRCEPYLRRLQLVAKEAHETRQAKGDEASS